jgi:class 3 adenylate cyclase/tetratricopeptide (TPR) repeat protein
MDTLPEAELEKISKLVAHYAGHAQVEDRKKQASKRAPGRPSYKQRRGRQASFDKLPKAERKHARQTALRMLKSLLSLGYRIQSPAGVHPVLRGPKVNELQQTVAKLRSEKPPLNELRTIWESRDRASWALFVEPYAALAEQLIQKGEPFIGHDVAVEGLNFFSADVRLRQLQALALARSGAPHEANRILRALLEEGHEDVETLSLLARTHKDFWRLAAAPSRRRKELRIAYGYYLRGFEKTRNYYPGINAAALALILGKQRDAKNLATEVRKICLHAIRDKDRSYWSMATLADAYLILGDVRSARRSYADAVSRGGNDWTAIYATRRQARILSSRVLRSAHALDDCLPITPVVVFCGHMIDAPRRPVDRFPAALAEKVKDEISLRLDQWKAQIGYASAACGSDILFLEAMLERGGEIHIVLPMALPDFRKLSVDIDAAGNWGRRFSRVLKQAASITYAAQHRYAGHPVVFEYSNQVLLGLAMLKCQMFETELRPLAVWDGKPGAGLGGTADSVRMWRDAKQRVEIVKLDPPSPATAAVKSQGHRAPATLRSGPPIPEQKIRSMLFADVVGYSKLDETEIPIYMSGFMGRVASLLRTTQHKPEVKNTWGDAVYLVFKSVRSAGVFAIELRNMIRKTKWQKIGLLKSLNVRIGLHAGPVFSFQDPVLKQPTYTGSHVSWTARIEPIAEEGQIYASEPFAALAAATGVKEFACDYVGEKRLAKKYGAARVYLIRKRF